jgi:hypothetical protein
MLDGVPTDGWKLKIDHWVDASRVLFESMAKEGFLAQHPIPIDKNNELMNGTHRLACAMALHINGVYVWQLTDKEAWAPDWGVDWFANHNVPREDIKRIISDFEAMCGQREPKPNEC